METLEQQNALKDAMARAKEIAAKLKQSAPVADGVAGAEEPDVKKRFTEEPSDVMDPKLVAQQVTNNLVQRAAMGPMQVEEITIPNKIVGIVIGKGGEMINKLQNESGAKVQVSPNLPPEMADEMGADHDRQITITGPADAVAKAKGFIAEIQALGKVPDHLLVGMEGEYTEDYLIPINKVGLVIGKGGETIKALQAQTGCKMVLIQDGLEDDVAEKPLRISGPEEAVLYGKQLVDDLVHSPDRPRGSGRGGHRPPFNGGGPGGPRPPWMGPGGPGGPRVPGGPGPRGPPRFGGPPQPGFKDMIIEVPANRAGLVIGKGGETIRMIKGETNISIQIDRSVPEESPFRIFRVQGTDEMISQTLAIIRDKTSDNSIMARDEEGNQFQETPYNQSGGWGEQGTWGQDNGWGGQYQGGWGQQQGGWDQSGWGQHGGWNQQPSWGQQGWGQQGQQGWGQQGWGQQQQGWGQQQPNAPPAATDSTPAASAAPSAQGAAHSYSQSSTSATSTTSTDTTQASTTATGQPDYSAAWAAYYQQQQQYYNQYYSQQGGAASAAATSTAATSTPAASAASSATSAAATTASSSASQAAAYAQYQQQLAEYQRKYGQQPAAQ